MRITNLLLAGAATLALAACSSIDDNSTWDGKSGGTVKFSSFIEGQKAVKATGTQWAAGDAVGVYMKATGAELGAATAANYKYITDDRGNLTAAAADQAIAYPESGNVDFVAYYPYTATVSGTSVAVDVADQSNQAAIDLLYSNNAVNQTSGSEAVNLGFIHQLSSIKLTITADATVASTAGLKVSLTGVPTSGTFDLANGTLTPATTTGNIALNVATDGKAAEGIVLPLTSTSAAKLQFVLGDKTVEAALPVSALAAGSRYAIPVKLTVSGGQAYVSFGAATITDWTEVPGGDVTVDFGNGGTVDPDPDPQPQPGQETTIFEEAFGTPEKKSNGYWPAFNEYTGYTSGLTFSDPQQIAGGFSYSQGSIRSTSTTTGHAWFPAGKDCELKMEGFTTTGYTNLTLTYEITANAAGNQQDIKVYCGDTEITVPSAAIATQNTFQEVKLTGLAAGFTSVTFVSEKDVNTAGFRIDNVKLVGTK